MIDTDKYEQAYEEWVLMEEPMGSFQTFLFVEYQKALTEVKRLRKQLEDCKRQIQFTADWIRDRGEGTHAKELDEFLEWME